MERLAAVGAAAARKAGEVKDLARPRQTSLGVPWCCSCWKMYVEMLVSYYPSHLMRYELSYLPMPHVAILSWVPQNPTTPQEASEAPSPLWRAVVHAHRSGALKPAQRWAKSPKIWASHCDFLMGQKYHKWQISQEEPGPNSKTWDFGQPLAERWVDWWA